MSYVIRAHWSHNFQANTLPHKRIDLSSAGFGPLNAILATTYCQDSVIPLKWNAFDNTRKKLKWRSFMHLNIKLLTTLPPLNSFLTHRVLGPVLHDWLIIFIVQIWYMHALCFDYIHRSYGVRILYSILTVCLTACLGWHKKIKARVNGSLWGESTGQKGPGTWKVFPYHDVIKHFFHQSKASRGVILSDTMQNQPAKKQQQNKA